MHGNSAAATFAADCQCLGAERFAQNAPTGRVYHVMVGLDLARDQRRPSPAKVASITVSLRLPVKGLAVKEHTRRLTLHHPLDDNR